MILKKKKKTSRNRTIYTTIGFQTKLSQSISGLCNQFSGSRPVFFLNLNKLRGCLNLFLVERKKVEKSKLDNLQHEQKNLMTLVSI